MRHLRSGHIPVSVGCIVTFHRCHLCIDGGDLITGERFSQSLTQLARILDGIGLDPVPFKNLGKINLQRFLKILTAVISPVVILGLKSLRADLHGQ